VLFQAAFPLSSVTINEYLLALLAGDRFFSARNVRSGFNLWKETIFLIGDYIGLSSVKVERIFIIIAVSPGVLDVFISAAITFVCESMQACCSKVLAFETS